MIDLNVKDILPFMMNQKQSASGLCLFQLIWQEMTFFPIMVHGRRLLEEFKLGSQGAWRLSSR